ncbi:MAG: hypothetical protein COA88_02360 [Kordia sp.]|nr:MAG: hypothetical protein COA88_02360 [Kordia sp.]
MKSLNFLAISVFILCFTSCTEKKASFKVTNNSNELIDSIEISSSGSEYLTKSVLINIKNREVVKIELDMENLPKVDGNYQIEVFSNNSSELKTFGYYSNGVPSGSIHLIDIKSDAIEITESFD